LLDAFAREQDMVAVDYVSLEGVSGSLPGNRTDIKLLIDRKRTRDDFDVLLVQDTSRFTRAGTQHAHRLEADLNAAGIDVIFAASAIPDGPVGELMKSVYGFSDQHHAKTISLGSARGSMSSILDERSAYCRRPPYGVDRLYVAPDGTPLHIIRNLPNGTQLKLHPKTKRVIGSFGVNEKTGVPNHYIKQKQERIALVPGDPKCVDVVRRIYRRHLVDNWGAYRIAQELNTGGVPSPMGKTWNTDTVRQILLNPIYLGRGIANRYTSAIYHMRANDRPLEVQVDKSELYNRRRPATRTRPESDWRYQDHPQLADLLDPRVRELAVAKQRIHLGAQAGGHVPKPNRDRHRNSSFFLKGILRSKQGDKPMTGHQSGGKKKRRYYRVREAHTNPDGNKVMRKLIPAEPLEQIVLGTVKTTLLSLPDLRERIEQQVRAAAKAAAEDSDHRAELVAERDSIRRKLELIIDDFDPAMKELVEGKVTELRAQLRAVDDRLARGEAAVPISEATVRTQVEATVAAIQRLAETLSNAPPATLNHFLRIVIGRLVVDLETRDAELEIALPAHLDAKSVEMCLVEGFAYKCRNETHPCPPATIAVYCLIWDRKLRRFHTETTRLIGEAAA
jgi:predicted  nucleic acid-binding Zn-ribbon protein